MGYTGEEIEKATGLTEAEAKEKLLKLIPPDILKTQQETYTKLLRLPTDTWGFIMTCLHAEPAHQVDVLVNLLNQQTRKESKND